MIGERFSSVLRDVLEERWQGLPLLATYAGVPGRDHTLGDWSPEAMDSRLPEKRSLLRRVRRSSTRPGEELDRRFIAGQLEVQCAELETWGRAGWDAALYPLNAVRSVHALMIRGFDRPRRRAAASRLREFPRALRDGLANLRRADQRAARLALAACRSGMDFLRHAVKGFDAEGAAIAGRALEDYSAAIRREVLPKAGRRFPAGRELFELKVRREHGLPYRTRELIELGREWMARTREEMAVVASSIDPASNWRSLLVKLRRDHPTAPRLLEVYRKETLRARRFCLDHKLVTMPPGERLDVLATPRFEWDTSPYAALLPPGAFDGSWRSCYWVTPVDPSWPAAKKRQRLEGHCRWGLASVCSHEGYPGHHVQLLRAKLAGRPARAVFSTPARVEGWALYCEQMMEEEGFAPDPRQKLYRLKDQLWRAARVVVDTGLHATGWSPERAVDFLVREALLEPFNAEAEVNRYTLTPAYPLCYLLGKLEILKLRERCRKGWGPRFSLGRFHDWLLDFGSVPPSWIDPSVVKLAA